MVHTLAKSIIIPIYISILTLPLLYLRYYPFKDKIRLRKPYFLGGLFCLLAFEWFCAVTVINKGSFLFIHYVDGVRLLSYFLYFAYSCIAIKEKISIHAMSCFLVMIFCGMLTLPCSLIEMFGEETYQVFLFRSIALIAEMTIFFFFGMKINKKIIIPVMEEASPKAVKLCSAILLLILTNDYIPTWNITWLKITPITYIAIRMVSVAEAIFVLFIFKKSVAQHNHMNQLRHENEIRERLAAVSQEHYTSLQGRIQESRRLKHDFKHKLIVIENLAAEGNNDKIIEMVKKENLYLDSCNLTTFSDNHELNTILSYYAEEAKKHGIECNIVCDIPKNSDMKEDDMWTIVGNLLTNAIEANERIDKGPRKIDLQIRSKGSLLAICEKNSFNPNFIQKNEDNYVTSKSSANCGNGLNSIRLIANKYGGNAIFKTENGLFISNVYAFI